MDPCRDIRGAIGFSKYRGRGLWGLVSRSIRFFTEGPWSHTFVVFNVNPVTGPLILEADKKRVMVDTLDKYQDPNYYFELWKPKDQCIPPSNITHGLRYAAKLLGKPYGFMQCLGFVFIWAARRLTFRKVNNLFGSGVICSELVLQYMKGSALELDKVLSLHRNSTSPNDLFKIISESQCFDKIELV